MDEQGLLGRANEWLQGRPPQVRADPAQERLVVEDTFEVPAHEVDLASGPSFAQALQQLVDSRSGLLTCEVSNTGASYRVVLSCPVYEDGFSRQTFVMAVTEVEKGRAGADALVAAIKSQAEIFAELEAKDAEFAKLLERPAVEAATGGWACTHVAPAGGLAAWAAPDPSAAPVTTLAAGVELQVRETRGDWANVAASNGWSGWVDGQRLVARP